MKVIRYQRHGCLSRLAKHKMMKWALAVNFFRWCAIARHLTVAGQSVGDVAMKGVGPPQLPDGAVESAGASRRRARESPTKSMDETPASGGAKWT